MAKIDGADPALFLNPSSYSGVKDEKKPKGLSSGSVRKGDRTDFSRIYNELSSLKADELGPLRDLDVSDESVNILMDEVRDAGDMLLNRPLPEEIVRYKKAVRNFINYIIQNNYSKEYEAGIPHFLKPGFSGVRGTDESKDRNKYVSIQIIDKKLEDLAAMLLASQRDQIMLASRLEEIRGLLIDLMQ
jgi:hypothetical protein